MAEDLRDIDLAPGITILPFLTVPNDATILQFQLQRATALDMTLWPDSATDVDVQIQVSINGGAFDFLCGFTATGGVVQSPEGGDAPISMVQTDIPAGINRRIRARLRVQNSALHTRARMRAV